MSIQRYDDWAGQVCTHEDGDYVLYSDHVKAMYDATAVAEKLERDRIRQAVRALATERELNSPSDIPVDLWEVLSIIDGGESNV